MTRSSTDGGIRCPHCEHHSRQILETRRYANRVYRRCVCSHCGDRFSTNEVLDNQPDSAHVLTLTQLLERLTDVQNQLSTIRLAIEEQLPL